jgi:hypothetical protein
VRMLGRTFGPKGKEVTGGWIKPYFPNVFRRPIKLRTMRCVGLVSRMGETRNTHKSVVGKPEET